MCGSAHDCGCVVNGSNASWVLLLHAQFLLHEWCFLVSTLFGISIPTSFKIHHCFLLWKPLLFFSRAPPPYAPASGCVPPYYDIKKQNSASISTAPEAALVTTIYKAWHALKLAFFQVQIHQRACCSSWDSVIVSLRNLAIAWFSYTHSTFTWRHVSMECYNWLFCNLIGLTRFWTVHKSLNSLALWEGVATPD